MQDSKKVIISLRDVTREFNTGDGKLEALKAISLDIYEGEFVAILGESGCGKTTVLNIMGGMDHLTNGTMILDGKDFSHPSPDELTAYRRNYIGFVFQDYHLMPNLTALENVNFIAELSPNSMPAEEAIEMVGLSDRKNNYPSQMSGGQQQRVSIARALCKHPRLILADEPTAALDFNTSIEVLQVFEDIVKRNQTTVVMVTHNNEISKMANRIVKIKDGQIDEIITNPSPTPAALLSW
ncbi:putative ABC transport system ATP-binding protein [Butyrivibrio sp. ob235]|uniref:ABC transporter ATP-binding protein n=1 Tax=Butyrivibrio sp. ob235 TaxID=1761780 RepID=UPI0008C018DF|nr:ABC transporter ATP-binding protein [Butyrivibrio sp. ob235]SEK84247.1 putative ABC transport system ATP-binding protein [Butyrivibrio sp. ob235]